MRVSQEDSSECMKQDENKEAVLQQQEQLLKNLEEIEIKINRYNSPQAKELIDAQVAFVKKEKRQLNLPNGFRV